MEVKVLGTGCAKCNKLFDVARQAVAGAGIDATVEKEEGIEKMMTYGVMMTPALVINGQVKSVGKVPKLQEIVTWLINEEASK